MNCIHNKIILIRDNVVNIFIKFNNICFINNFFSANIIYKDKLAKKLNIIDKIDENKIHEQDTSLNGAFHILFIINLSLLFNYFLNKDFDLLLIVIGSKFFSYWFS